MRRAVMLAGAFALGVLSNALPAQSRTLKVPSQVLGEQKVVHVHLPRDYALAK